ncbi:pyruvate dehydrogenase complex dihydrolipoamide acetyltransferase [Paraburkholderia sp. J12]|uniref:pyruvate dehydrogenase complex dihydrolipoamide acetyltransferase n=1 Tax=Paraburkholderia sp. J12 TaxID=2805432 RepID=UPI002ABE6EA6|nr:pyruvate dehydrogenase complex dihydrolipoamide acetyltransferase [Paraburkholderia sp. J12]
MATILRMPEVAANATHATLVNWLKREGDPVREGEGLAEIETDKAIVELEAEAAGTMGAQLVAAGSEVEVGATVGVLLAVGENAQDAETLLAASEPTHAAAGTPAEAAASGAATTRVKSAQATGERVFSSPLARRIAAERGIALAGLRGSGPNGRIVRRDVEQAQSDVPVSASALAASAASNVTPAPMESAATQVAVAAAGYTEVPHSGMRKTIARRLSESKSTIPHFYLNAACRMDALLALRSQINGSSSRRISINDFIVRAVAVALQDVPEANVGWTDTAMRRYAHADVAVAVATGTGLMTPIVRDAARKTLATISAEIEDLAERARAGRLLPADYQGGSFSISNLGMYGVTEFSAIINPPQAAILAVGACEEQAVVQDGAVVVAQVMRCTLSVDHRAIDGALAAQWLAAFRRRIENPLTLLV